MKECDILVGHSYFRGSRPQPQDLCPWQGLARCAFKPRLNCFDFFVNFLCTRSFNSTCNKSATNRTRRSLGVISNQICLFQAFGHFCCIVPTHFHTYTSYKPNSERINYGKASNNSNSNNQISIAPYASYRGAGMCKRFSS